MLAALIFLLALCLAQPVLWYSAKLVWWLTCRRFNRKVAVATLQKP